MAKNGGARPGAGRPLNSVSKRSSEVIAAALGEGITPAEFMLKMMRDETAGMKDRQWAADKVSSFVHPRPAPIARTIEIELPDTSTPDGLMKGAAAILQAVSKGQIAPSEAQSLMAVLEMQRKAIETSDLIDRMEKLEELLEEKGRQR